MIVKNGVKFRLGLCCRNHIAFLACRNIEHHFFPTSLYFLCFPKWSNDIFDLRQTHWWPCKIRLNSKRTRVLKTGAKLQFKKLHKMTTAKIHGNYWILEGGSLNQFKLVAAIRNSAAYQLQMTSPAGSLLYVLTSLEMNVLWDISPHHITGKYQDTLSMLGHQPTVCPWQQDTDPEPVHPAFTKFLASQQSRINLFCHYTASAVELIHLFHASAHNIPHSQLLTS